MEASLAEVKENKACESWCFDRSLCAVCIPSNPRYDAARCDTAKMDPATVCTWSGCGGCSQCQADACPGFFGGVNIATTVVTDASTPGAFLAGMTGDSSMNVNIATTVVTDA